MGRVRGGGVSVETEKGEQPSWGVGQEGGALERAEGSSKDATSRLHILSCWPVRETQDSGFCVNSCGLSSRGLDPMRPDREPQTPCFLGRPGTCRVSLGTTFVFLPLFSFCVFPVASLLAFSPLSVAHCVQGLGFVFVCFYNRQERLHVFYLELFCLWQS